MEGRHGFTRGARLLEREAQLATIERAVRDGAAGGGRGLGIVAEAGLGKSSLLEAAADAAAAQGLAVRRARGAELERAFPFGAVLQLLGRDAPALEADGLFAGAAQLARPLLLGERQAADLAAGDPAPVINGLFWLVSELAQRRPLALLVDDIHWADELSLRFVLFLLDNIRDIPGVIAFAARPAEPGAPQALITRLLAHAEVAEARPEPLSRDAVAAVLDAAGTTAVADACHEVTGGNPLLLRELLLAVGDGALTVEHVRAIGPEPVARALAVSLSRLPEAARALTRAVAVLGDGARLRDAAAVAGLDLEAAAAAAGALESASIFRDHDGLAFSHPIVRAAVYSGLPPTERAIAHRQAAKVLDGEAPVERVAAHVAEAPAAQDPWAVAVLVQAAERSAARGAPEAAARSLERALAEPPDAVARVRVLAALARAQAAAGDARASATYEQAIAAGPTARERSQLLFELGTLQTHAADLATAAGTLDRGMAELGDEDDELRLELESAWVMASLFNPEVGVAAMERMGPLLAPGTQPRTPGQRKVLAHLAGAEGLRIGDRERGIEMALRAWGDGAMLEDISAADPTTGSVTAGLSFGEDFEATIAVCDVLVDDARRRGSALAFVSGSYLRGSVRLLQGQLRESIADLEVAVDGRRSGWQQYRPRAMGQLAEACFEMGDTARADALIAAAQQEPDYGEGLIWGAYFDHEGTLALIRGDTDAALAAYVRSRDAFLATLGPATNPVFSPWRRNSALALARLGRRDEALALVEEDVARAHDWGAPTTIGTALAARGIIRGRDGLDDLREAAEWLDRPSVGLPLVRGLMALADGLRTAGLTTEATDAYRRALDVADACGAVRLAGIARDALIAAGARPRRARLSGVASLTPSEMRVARMAADGMSNREIAEALFVTRKAVEFHLRNVYVKLGIAARTELPAALTA